MKRLLIAAVTALLIQISFLGVVQAQLTSLPSGGNKRALVSEQVGLTDVTIVYNRPGVKGREGHIWGELVPVGYVDQGFGSSKAAPWRAGANENTTIQFSTDVKIEGQTLPAGKYGFFVAYDPNECTLIFSKNSASWGSFYYNAGDDALRVKVKPIAADKSVERLKYEFANQTPESAVVELEWEKLIIPFKIEADVVNTQVEFFRKELTSQKGFNWEAWDQAALYCGQNKVNLEQALLWADTATSVNFGGSQTFTPWSTRALILTDLNRPDEATETMKKALPYGSELELYQYAKILAIGKKGKEALEVFKINYDKHPNTFFTNFGLTRGYSAIGDYKKALAYALKADAQAPSKPNKDVVDKAIKTLQDGKDINM